MKKKEIRRICNQYTKSASKNSRNCKGNGSLFCSICALCMPPSPSNFAGVQVCLCSTCDWSGGGGDRRTRMVAEQWEGDRVVCGCSVFCSSCAGVQIRVWRGRGGGILSTSILELFLLSNSSPDFEHYALLCSSFLVLQYERDGGAIKDSFGRP